MTVNLDDIRQGLVTNLASIADCQKVPYRSGNPNPPALVVVGVESLSRVAMGSWSVGFVVQGIAGKALNSGAERRLDRWLLPGGDEDVWAALESDKTLGGKVDDVVVVSCDGSQTVTLDNGTEVLASTWHLTVEF